LEEVTRTFESGPARRARMPLMISIVGASGSGKTLSAILTAEGIQRVQPGPIVVIDTEALRALKHADGNPDRFVHVPFTAPFGPLDYIDAFKHALKHPPSTVIVDSMSHEWEGPGGVIEQHA
jgi:ABC-type glutathione transport system ATPase component